MQEKFRHDSRSIGRYKQKKRRNISFQGSKRRFPLISLPNLRLLVIGSERCRIRTRVDGSEARQDIQTTLTARYHWGRTPSFKSSEGGGDYNGDMADITLPRKRLQFLLSKYRDASLSNRCVANCDADGHAPQSVQQRRIRNSHSTQRFNDFSVRVSGYRFSRSTSPRPLLNIRTSSNWMPNLSLDFECG